MTVSAEQAELNSLITQHLALSNVLGIPEIKTSTILWPPKIPDASKSKVMLETKAIKTPRLVTVNGSKLHTVPNVPYPLSYAQEVLDSDICDRITLKKLCKNGLTLHDFNEENAPDKVLDIGTGAGSWIIEAAETWKNASSLVGFDLVEIQPALSLNGPLASLHGRIRWVQGNALEALPFSADEFDFVRICRIALGIPETKWNHIIEEAVRVLKPNGILEIIEEDIIFPCRQSSEDYIPPLLETSSISHSASVSIHGDQDSSGSSAADHSMSPTPKVSSRRPLSIMVPRTLSSRTRSRSLGSQSSGASAAVAAVKSAIANAPVSAMPQTSYLPALSSTESDKLGIPLRDPRDHSILNSAWHAMLDNKFISPKPTSLLSLYLSFHLQSIRSHEPIQVIAPQPSYISEQRRHIPPYLEEGPYEMRLVPVDAAPSTHSRSSGIFTTRDAAMHLRRCLQVVLGCQEALWEQVKKTHPVMPREYFDYILHDFELDMLDRIDTRSALKSSIGWDARQDTSDLAKWRDRVATFPHDEIDPPLICRTIRGFVGVKASS